jgi:hypothetical protein
LALVAAVIDPVLAKEHPEKAAHLAANLVHEAQRRIESPFDEENDLSPEEESLREGRRLEQERLFRDSIPVVIAFKDCDTGYKTLGRFAAVLREAQLSYETLDIVEGDRWSVVEFTSTQAVAMLPAWKKARENTLNLANKRKRQSGKTRKDAGNQAPKKRKKRVRTGKQKG